MSQLEEDSVILSKIAVHQIRIVLEDVLNNEECYADIAGGTAMCLHCNASLALSYLKEDK